MGPARRPDVGLRPLSHAARRVAEGELAAPSPASGTHRKTTTLGLVAAALGSERAPSSVVVPDCVQASSRADRLCRGLLCALCRSPGLDVHSGRVLGLLDDAPLLGQASASLLRCARYSPDPHAAQLLAFAPHHDRGVLTLVASAQEQGLQVRLPQQGQGAGAGAGAWVDVPLGPGRVAVLCGYSLSYALGGLLQPALHRVRPVAVAGGGGAAGGSAATAGSGRVSLAYELCVRPNAFVDPAAVTQGAAEQLPAAAAAAAGEGGAASRWAPVYASCAAAAES